jgi:adenosine deaminase
VDLDMQKLPKIELHSHLDCCLSYDAVRRIDPNITRDDYDRRFVARPKCASLAEYLSYTFNYRNLLQSERALRIAVQDVFAQMAADGIVYAELRFAPLIHMAEGLSADDVVRCVSDETTRQIGAAGIEASLILCTLRDYTAEQSMETARLVERYAASGPVAAMDIAGDEIAYPLDTHVPAFAHVRNAGLGITIHAGEAGGPASVWEALEKTGTRRIGHGVQSIEDESLVAHLGNERIHLEICPTCNVQTSAVTSLEEHPVDRLYRHGVPVGISTDTRAVTDVRLTQEYERLRDVFGWTLADLRQVNLNAIDASFAAGNVKERLTGIIEAAYAGA